MAATGPAVAAYATRKLAAVPHLAFAVTPTTTCVDAGGPGGGCEKIHAAAGTADDVARSAGTGAVVLSSVSGESAAATLAALQNAGSAERRTYAAYGELAEIKEAVQASVMWLTVFVPYSTGLMLTLSRGSMGGGNSQVRP